jgi:hypothetical protein
MTVKPVMKTAQKAALPAVDTVIAMPLKIITLIVADSP